MSSGSIARPAPMSHAGSDQAEPAPDVRKDRGLDWVIIALSLAALFILGGTGALVWMFSNREYWASDPTMPSVFVMFSKVINGSTIGVLLIFVGVIVATAALLGAYFRQRHEQLHTVLTNQGHDRVAVELDRIRRDHALKEWLEDRFDQLTSANLRQDVQLAGLADAMTYVVQGSTYNGEVLEDLSRRIPHPVRVPRRPRAGRSGKDKPDAARLEVTLKEAEQRGYANGYVDATDARAEGKVNGRVVKLPLSTRGDTKHDQDPSS